MVRMHTPSEPPAPIPGRRSSRSRRLPSRRASTWRHYRRDALPHRHDSGTCDLCLEGCMTLALILVIGIYTGVGFLLAQIFIHLTPTDRGM